MGEQKKNIMQLFNELTSHHGEALGLLGRVMAGKALATAHTPLEDGDLLLVTLEGARMTEAERQSLRGMHQAISRNGRRVTILGVPPDFKFDVANTALLDEPAVAKWLEEHGWQRKPDAQSQAEPPLLPSA